jgi:hypothetical protein
MILSTLKGGDGSFADNTYTADNASDQPYVSKQYFPTQPWNKWASKLLRDIIYV